MDLHRHRRLTRPLGLRLTALVLAVAAGSAGCSSTEQPADLEAVAQALLGDAVEVRSGGDFGLQNLRLHDDGVLEVAYPEGTASGEASDGDERGGAQAYLQLREGPVDALHLRYSVLFPDGFDFVKGGKLPGLYGGTATSGGKVPDGTDGFSTRYMWRKGGAGEVYAYLPGSEEHGTSLGRGSWTFPTGRWACVEQELRLNTPGEEDGELRVRLDGEEVLVEDDLLLRTVPDLRIEGVFFSTFFGGSDDSWATPTDQTASFRDFAVGQEPLGCPGQG